MHARATPRQLSGCYVISLRPVGGHDGVRRAAAALGARTLALSPWRIRALADDDARTALARALAAPRVVFTFQAQQATTGDLLIVVRNDDNRRLAGACFGLYEADQTVAEIWRAFGSSSTPITTSKSSLARR